MLEFFGFQGPLELGIIGFSPSSQEAKAALLATLHKYLECQGDLVSRLVTPIIHIITLLPDYRHY